MADKISDEEPHDLALVSEDYPDSRLVEITAHIRADQALALELLENAGRLREGKSFDKDQLVREALDLLIARSFVAVGLAKNKSLKPPDNREDPPST